MLDIKLEIESTDIDKREHKGRVFRTQKGIVHGLGKYPKEISIAHWDAESPPYPIGMYEITNDSFYVDGYGKLSFKLNLNDLTKIEPQKPKAING